MYTPVCDTAGIAVRGYAETAAEELTAVTDYDRAVWWYVPCRFEPYRYILGTRGENPLICVGINPSTAVPGDLDNTLKSVERIARHNGFDSFIMFNVYAQRATDPDKMDRECNPRLHRENLAAFRAALTAGTAAPTVWAAWGTLIEKRPYLQDCLRDMIAVGEECGARWVTAGKRSRRGHPHHPLYLRRDCPLDPFDIKDYRW